MAEDVDPATGEKKDDEKPNFRWMERNCNRDTVQKLLVLPARLETHDLYFFPSSHFQKNNIILMHPQCQDFFVNVCTTEFQKEYRAKRDKLKAWWFLFVHRPFQWKFQAKNKEFFFNIRKDDPDSSETLEEQASNVFQRFPTTCINLLVSSSSLDRFGTTEWRYVSGFWCSEDPHPLSLKWRPALRQ